MLALAFFGAWLLWRSRRERVAAVIPERREAERAAELLLGVCAAQWVVAAFALDALTGPWFPGLPLAGLLPAAAALAAWGLRHAPRIGAALGALTLITSAWLLVDREPWASPPADVPFGPLEALLPAYGGDPLWPVACTAIVLAALAALALREWRTWPGRA